jgi:hypothetical protein
MAHAWPAAQCAGSGTAGREAAPVSDIVPEPQVIFGVDEFGPLNLQTRLGRHWAARSRAPTTSPLIARACVVTGGLPCHRLRWAGDNPADSVRYPARVLNPGLQRVIT